MPNAKTLVLSLTGPGSHTIEVPAGQGSLSIGPVVPGESKPDVVVGPDDVLDWSTFDGFTVPAGYPWPRVLRYRGSDIGFLAWSGRRSIEQFAWTLTAPMTVDASAANIHHLTVSLRDAALTIVLPAATISFTVDGDLALLQAEPAAGSACPGLYFYPDTRASRDAEPLKLPPLPSLGEAASIYVGAKPLRQAFDCTSLLQFPQLTHVRLVGQLTNLGALAQLPHVQRLQLGDCPDLTGLPPLTTWPGLRDFDASNIAQEAGRDLRQQLKDLRLPHASVTRLRTAEWFERDYGLPFSQWPTATARRAIKAFRAAEATDDPATGIRTFIRAINDLPGVYTIECEDVAEAVALLAAHAKIAEDLAMSWFDADRDF